MRADEITAPFSSSGGERKIMKHFVVRVCEIALLDLVTQLLGHLPRYPRVRDLVGGNFPAGKLAQQLQ